MKLRAERDTPLLSLPSSLHWPQQCCCLGNHNPPPVPLSPVTPSCLDSPLIFFLSKLLPPPQPPTKEGPGGKAGRTLLSSRPGAKALIASLDLPSLGSFWKALGKGERGRTHDLSKNSSECMVALYRCPKTSG